MDKKNKHNAKPLTRYYGNDTNGNIPYFIERADLYISQHIGQEVTIKAIREYAYSNKSGGGLGNYIVRKALERYNYDLRFNGNTRIFTPIERTHTIPLDVAFANGHPPIGRNGRVASYDNQANDNSSHSVLWRRMLCDYAPYRECIVESKDDAIAWNEAHTGKNTTSDRLDWDLF